MEIGVLLKSGFESAKKWTISHSSELEIGAGITGFFTALGFGIYATSKAVPMIEQKKKKMHKKSLTAKETFNTVWKLYIPTAGSAIISSALIIHGTNSMGKANAALATACSLTEAAFRDYQDKVVEVVGEKKERQIRSEIAKDTVTKTPPPKNTELMVNSGYGQCIIYEPITKTYFLSTPEAVRKSENRYNRRIIGGEMYLPINEFWTDIGLRARAEGDIIGNNVDHPLELGPFHAQVDENERPVLVINYERSAPTKEYMKI